MREKPRRFVLTDEGRKYLADMEELADLLAQSQYADLSSIERHDLERRKNNVRKRLRRAERRADDDR